MRKVNIPLILAVILLGACQVPSVESVKVRGTGDEEFLKLRAGPGLGYKVILGLPDGTLLSRRTCVTEVGQLWCKVALATAPGVTGYVAADYLSAP
jgi:uncharacterized protein YraI